jgi:hypothetical protein
MLSCFITIKICLRFCLYTSYFYLWPFVVLSWFLCFMFGVRFRSILSRFVFITRLLFHEHVNVSKWTWTNLFWNILLMSIKYLENIIWHMRWNILWCRGIFCHMFIDEWYLWMKMWMTNEKWINFFMNVGNKYFCVKLNKRMEKNYIGLFWKIRCMKCWNQTSNHIYINLTWSILSFATSKQYRMLN